MLRSLPFLTNITEINLLDFTFLHYNVSIDKYVASRISSRISGKARIDNQNNPVAVEYVRMVRK